MSPSRPPCSLPRLFHPARPFSGHLPVHHRGLLTLTLLVAVTGACGEPQPSFDPALVAAAPAIDWNLLVTDTSERRTRQRDERLGAGPVRIAGYLVPLEDLPLDQSRVRLTEFLLVPYMGACIHYPPPPPDQMIHVQMAADQAASLDLFSWDPMEVAGVLREETLDSVYGAIGYRMDGLAIGEYGGWSEPDTDLTFEEAF